MYRSKLLTLLLSFAFMPAYATIAESDCFGMVNNGRIENSVKLLDSGPNYSAYSTIAATAGRAYVHSTVAEIIVSAYAALTIERPSTSINCTLQRRLTA